MMKYFVLILIMLACANAYCQVSKKTGDLICWQENIKLNWSDFKAQKSPLNKNDSLYNINTASVAPELSVHGTIKADGSKAFVVKVALDRMKAWVRDSLFFRPEILQHEQLHFDIAELVARRLRARINQARKNGIDIFGIEFSKEIKDFLNEQVRINTLYDNETENGALIEKQRKWNNYIRQELIKLSIYSSTVDDCNY